MTMEERIEAAARKLGYRHDDHTMRTVLAAAFPELFDGTAWIAPTQPTDEMAYIGEGYSDFGDTPGVIEGREGRIREVKMIYEIMRDVYVTGFGTDRDPNYPRLRRAREAKQFVTPPSS